MHRVRVHWLRRQPKQLCEQRRLRRHVRQGAIQAVDLRQISAKIVPELRQMSAARLSKPSSNYVMPNHVV